MVKNRAAKEAARKLKAETGITYPRALDLVRAAGREFIYPNLTIGTAAGSPVTWQPRAGARLEISGWSGTGKSELMASMAAQAAAAGIEVHIIDPDKHGAGYSKIEGAHVTSDRDGAQAVFSDLTGKPRPAIVFFEGVSALASGMDTVSREMSAAAGELADAGYPVIAAWQSEPAIWPGSARILLGRTVPQQRTAFFGSPVSGSPQFMEGHYRAGGNGLPVLFQLCPDSVLPAVPVTAGEAPRFDDLNLPPAVRGFASVGPGLYVFAGLTASGRSLSMAAVLNLITEKYARRVTVIEEVLELPVNAGLSEVRRRIVGKDETTDVVITEAVRDVRDIIVVGDARSPEDFHAALLAAQAGHTVFLSMHAESAARVPFRILDAIMTNGWPVTAKDVASALKWVLFQKLVETADNTLRVPAVELMTVTHRVRELISDDSRDALASLVKAGEPGMIPLATSLSQLVLDGLITEEAAEKAAENPMDFRRALHAGKRHSAQSITLGTTSKGDKVRHALGLQQNLLAIRADPGRRGEALAAVAGRFPGEVHRVDPRNAGAELAEMLEESRALARRISQWDGPYSELPAEVRPARRCIVVDVPDMVAAGESAGSWFAPLARLSREASRVGVTLLIGVESDAQLKLLGDDLTLTARRLDLDGETPTYRSGSSADPVPFSPVWEAHAA